MRPSAGRRAVAAGIAIVVGLTVAGVRLATRQPATRPSPALGPCDRSPSIDVVARAPSKTWQKLTLPKETVCFRLAASRTGRAGVARDAHFTLSAPVSVGAADVERRLRVVPAVKFTVAAIGSSVGEHRFRITPAARLRVATTYRFRMTDAAGAGAVQRWAFQTVSPLRVVQTLPRDQATDVPTDVGIELTFSHDGVSSVEQRFHIDPAVAGRFETHKRTVVFVPKKLAVRTLYSVTLDPGVQVRGTDTRMSEGTSFSFETGTGGRGGGGAEVGFNRTLWESALGDPPTLGLFAYLGNKTVPRADVTVWRYPGIESFIRDLDARASIPPWTTFAARRFSVDTDPLERVSSFDATVREADSYGDRFIVFPAALPEGYYYVRAMIAKVPASTWLQVTNIASYASLSERRTLVWVNDIGTKAAIAGARVEVAGGSFHTQTGADGTAFFATPAELVTLRDDVLGRAPAQTPRNLIVTNGAHRSVVPVSALFSGFVSFDFRESDFAGDPNAFWRFLHTDRRLYHPTDVVRFWGLVRARENPVRAQTITMLLTGYSDTGDEIEYARTTVTANARGTFIGELPIESVAPGYYQVRAQVGDKVIASDSINVRDFAKPAYKIDVETTPRAVFAGDRVRFEINTAFFEGTPVPGVGLKYEGATRGSLTTNDKGEAAITYTARIPRGYDGYAYQDVNVVPARTEEGDISGGGQVRVFPAALDFDAEARAVADQARVTGTLHTVSLDRINAGTSEEYRGPVARNRRVTAAVTEITYRKVADGEHYDFIEKKVVKEYRHEEVRRSYGTFRDTTDARGRFTLSFSTEPDRSYEVELSALDDAGRVARTTRWVYRGAGRYFAGASNEIQIAGAEDAVAVGDRVSLTMQRGTVVMPSGGDDRYLFYTAHLGIRAYEVRPDPHFAFTFSDADVPDVEVMGVRFTGARFQSTPYPVMVSFKRDLRKLSVEVTPRAGQYRPGETAQLDVSVRDRAGKPARAEVLLGAVDDALYRLQGQDFFSDLGILDSLYETVPSGVLRTYESHPTLKAVPSAEYGGEGGAREDFRDVALFRRVETGDDGAATVSFHLPDNTTSWRVTAIAVTDDLFAGSATALVQVGLPVFVDVALNTSYLLADRPNVRVRAFGEALRAGDPVEFTMRAPTLADRTVTARATAFEPIDLALPDLKEGHHTITIGVRAGERQDAVVREIDVVRSHLVHSVSRFVEGHAGDHVDPGIAPKGPARIVLSDHNRGRYHAVLEGLSWTYGDRADQKLSRIISRELLQKYFHDVLFGPPEGFRGSAYQTAKGGITIYPFSDDDLALSARIAALSPGRFDRELLLRYFQAVDDDPKESRERAIIALYGRAALNDDVLGDVQAAAARTDLSARERLYLGLAAAALEDQDTARRLYRAVLSASGQQRGAAARVLVGKDQDDILEATSLAAILGAALADELAPALFEYTTTEGTTDLLIALEQISFLSGALPNLSADPVRVRYSLGDRRVDKTIADGGSLTLRVTPAQVRALDIEVVSGNLGVASAYEEALDPASVRSDPDVRMTRAYQGASGSRVTLSEGDLALITLSFTLSARAASGCYQVSDFLPSGLRPVTTYQQQAFAEREQGGENVWIPYDTVGQRVSFCVYRGQKPPQIRYHARVLGTGTYTADPVVLQSQQVPDSIDLGTALTVEIR